MIIMEYMLEIRREMYCFVKKIALMDKYYA